MAKAQIIALVGASLVVTSAWTAAVAQSRGTRAAASRDVGQLMQMMDKDKNGTVSKEEFLDFMSQTFDQLDVNKNGTLEAGELSRLPRVLPRDRVANPPRGNPNRIRQNATTQPF